MIAVDEEEATQATGSAARAGRAHPGATEPGADRRSAVIVGLLQLAPKTSLRGSTFIALDQSLRAAPLPERAGTTVDLWLDSPGGSARDAYKIGLLLRSIGSRIRVVIPDYAKSAATLLSLVADEIYVGPAAELGPLDAQLDYEKSPGTRVSALDRIGNLNEITEAARDIVLELGGEVRYTTKLGPSETVSVMAGLASSLLQPLVSQVDPTILHQSNRMLKEAAEYGNRLMLTRQDCPPDLAMSLPKRLTKDYPTHGYAISLDEAAELGLPVRPLADYEFCGQVMACYLENQASRTNVIEVVNVIEIAGPGTPDEATPKSRRKSAKEVEEGNRMADAEVRVTPSPAVRAANALTGRWCGRLGDGDFALSGAGLWPLLGLLASAADESAAAELAAALGRPADCAARDALELIDMLRAGESTTAALGLWTRKDVPLQPQWASGLPAGVVGTLTDQQALNRWAARETDGLITEFPLEITPATALVLASALAARVKWCEPFDTHPRNGNWESSEPDQQWLSRTTYDLSVAAVLDELVTRVVVEGDGDVDVHLLIGDEPPGEVLAAGLRELAGAARVAHAGDRPTGGPGLTVRRVPSWLDQDILYLKLPSFAITAHHDLLEHTEVFGLRSVTDAVTSHLPKLSPVPLFVSDGAQDVVARFFAEGFEAAAVTAFGVAMTGAPPDEDRQVTLVSVTVDRPFGFLAVHRPSRLAVVAGWVDSPFRQGAQA